MNTTSGKIIDILFSDLGKDEEDWNSGNYIYDNDDTNSVNLRCCGNCKHYEYESCLKERSNGIRHSCKVCSLWEWDEETYKDRLLED